MRWLRDNGLTIALLLMFVGSIIGQWVAGWHVAHDDALRHGEPLMSLSAYAISPDFLSSVFENWESEFLQMATYVVLTAILFQRGSAESKDPDESDRAIRISQRRRTSRTRPRFCGGDRSGEHSMPDRSALRSRCCSLRLFSFTGHKVPRWRQRMRSRMAKPHGRPLDICSTRSSGLNRCRTGRANSCQPRSWWCCRSFCASESHPNPSRSRHPTARRACDDSPQGRPAFHPCDRAGPSRLSGSARRSLVSSRPSFRASCRARTGRGRHFRPRRHHGEPIKRSRA